MYIKIIYIYIYNYVLYLSFYVYSYLLYKWCLCVKSKVCKESNDWNVYIVLQLFIALLDKGQKSLCDGQPSVRPSLNNFVVATLNSNKIN